MDYISRELYKENIQNNSLELKSFESKMILNKVIVIIHNGRRIKNLSSTFIYVLKIRWIKNHILLEFL